MRKISRSQLEVKLKYNRKIHMLSGTWLVSLYSTKSKQGSFKINFHNIVHYPLTFLMVPVKVID